MRFKLGYLTKQAFHGIFRNGVMSTASILILVLCLLVIGSFWMINTNIDTNLNEIDDLNLIIIYLKDDANPLDINNSLEEIPGDPTIKYYSASENLRIYKEKYASIGKSELLEIFDDTNNPLPDSFEITFDDVNKSSTIMYHLSNIEGIDQIRDMLEISQGVEEIKKAVTVICAWLLIILSVVSLLVIVITIRLAIYARSKEIILMKHIGATNRFIRTPFIIEGIIIGTVSAALALGLQYYLYDFIMTDLISQYNMITIVPFNHFLIELSAAFLGVGLFAGIIASSISIRKYLRS